MPDSFGGTLLGIANIQNWTKLNSNPQLKDKATQTGSAELRLSGVQIGRLAAAVRSRISRSETECGRKHKRNRYHRVKDLRRTQAQPSI